jgi:hypothetical protein
MKTMFGDVTQGAWVVYRVKTRSSVYLVGIHHHQGRKILVLRGEPGSDKEDVVVRDSDPRVDDRSLWDVPVEQWVGKSLQVATMTTSPVEAVTQERDQRLVRAVTQVTTTKVQPERSDEHSRAKAMVTGQARQTSNEPKQQTTYPESHVEYAEEAAAYLRAVVRKERLFDDAAVDSLLYNRLQLALSNCALLLEQLRHRLPK